MKISRFLPLVPALLALAGTAEAQFPRHTLTSVFPAGGRAGENVEVQIAGTEADGAVTLAFDHPGLRAFRGKGAKFTVAIAPDVPAGHYDVRLVGPLGVGNARS